MEKKRKLDDLEDLEKFVNDYSEDDDEEVYDIDYFRPTSTSDRRVLFNKTLIQNTINEVMARRKKGDQLIAGLKTILKEIESLPYEEGDVAFHKKHGNVIIDKVEYNYMDVSKTKYVLVSRKKEMDEDGDMVSPKASAKDLLPSTKAAKVLYGENK